MTHVPVDILWCARGPKNRSNGWTFPRAIERHLRTLTASKRVLHLFGGLATWGLRLDIDRQTRPDVIGDAWLPPFRQNAFDVVILDPPYVNFNQQMKSQLLRGAAFVAAESVIWFHTTWISGDGGCRLERGWLVRVGDSCACRCLQIFRTRREKPLPRLYFSRGPAIRYNRWLVQPERLPLEASIPEV